MTKQEINWWNFWSAIATAGAWYMEFGVDIDPAPYMIENPEYLNDGVCWTNALSDMAHSMLKQACAYQAGWNRWGDGEVWKE